jgi:hypothetical protein
VDVAMKYRLTGLLTDIDTHIESLDQLIRHLNMVEPGPSPAPNIKSNVTVIK